MVQFTVEETNLMSIYQEGGKAQLMENMTAALPDMDADMRELAERTISKVDALTDEEYAGLAVYAADECGKAADAAAKPESQCPCKTGVLQLRRR